MDNRGFTLLEMIAAIALMGILLSMVAYQFDLSNFRSQREIESLKFFFREQITGVLGTGVPVRILIDEDQNQIIVRRNARRTDLLGLEDWSINQLESEQFHLTPTGALGKSNFEIRRGEDRRRVQITRLLEVDVRERESD